MNRGYSLEYAEHRLLYRHAFGTAHGTRSGTEAVFIRLAWQDAVGYGEASLPPYVDETTSSVIEALKTYDHQSLTPNYLKHNSAALEGSEWHGAPAAQAALTMALLDLKSKLSGRSVTELLGSVIEPKTGTNTSVTLGLGAIKDIPLRLSQLPESDLIKVKLGGSEDLEMLRAVQACDSRPLFLDANQGWTSLAQALNVLKAVSPGRLAGLEQPFSKEAWPLQAELQKQLGVTIYGDESIQGIGDIEKAVGHFGGVNIKLMKCGGLDRALAMIKRSQELGLKVMLGCMSESSLGCAAMAQLQSYADVADLDGPWLIGNDPFSGLHLEPGRLWVEGNSGFGVVPALSLNWIPIGA